MQGSTRQCALFSNLFHLPEFADCIEDVCVFKQLQIFANFFVESDFTRASSARENLEQTSLAMWHLVIPDEEFIARAVHIDINHEFSFVNANGPMHFFARLSVLKLRAVMKYHVFFENATVLNGKSLPLEHKRCAQLTAEFTFKRKARIMHCTPRNNARHF